MCVAGYLRLANDEHVLKVKGWDADWPKQILVRLLRSRARAWDSGSGQGLGLGLVLWLGQTVKSLSLISASQCWVPHAAMTSRTPHPAPRPWIKSANL